MKKIMVTGSNGLVGQHLIHALVQRNDVSVIALGKGHDRSALPEKPQYQYIDADITDGVRMREIVLEHRPDTVIHGAAMTQVDDCEQDKPHCYNVNVSATRFIIEPMEEIGARLIYLSTDFIFSGNNGPYDEQAEPDPVNYYGSTKVQAEKAVMESQLDWAIIRTVLVYGNTIEGTRGNILTWIKGQLEKGEAIKVVSDQERTPTYVQDLVKGILLILDKDKKGVYHISGAETLSPYQMAIAAAEYLGLPGSLIEKVDSSTFRQLGQRPLKTGFIIDKASRELGYAPISFRQALQELYPR